MKQDQVKAVLYEILGGFNRYGEKITDETKLVDDLGIDSLGILVLIAELESKYYIKIDTEKERTRNNFDTVKALYDFMTKKINKNANL